MGKRTGLSAGLLLVFATLVLGADPSGVRIVNQTGYEINEIYLAPTDSGEWGEDLLTEDPLANEASHVFDLSGLKLTPERGNVDIKLVDVDGDEYAKYDVDLFENSEIIVTFDDYLEKETKEEQAPDRYDEGYQEGYEAGLTKGKQEGFKEGYGQGFKDGYKDGNSKGR